MLFKPTLLSVDDAKRLDVAGATKLFSDHINPGQLHFLRLLGFNHRLFDQAEGMYYIDKNGRKILDLFGGFGALALGHNHRRILEVRQKFMEEKRHDIAIGFVSQYASALASNLAAIAPGNLSMVFLGSTGSEVVEAALKLAERVQGPKRSTIAYAHNSFHGKTRGALSVTDSAFYQSTFQLLANRVRVPFDDVEALEDVFRRDRSVGILILETVQGGGGIILPSAAYWRHVREICDRYEVLWIADEIQCGVGRTGRFFAFEHESVVPDIVTLAKSLGGGKSAIGCMLAKQPHYMAAYGTSKTALIHAAATFGGMGEACCTAIEVLNVLYDEGLIENAERQGSYLIEKLGKLRDKYPQFVKDVRGQGLMIGLEFQDLSRSLPIGLRHVVSSLDERLQGSLCALVGSLLFREYDMLVAFTEYNRNVIRLEPPLIVAAHEIDLFIDALDNLLSRGLARIVKDYLTSMSRALQH